MTIYYVYKHAMVCIIPDCGDNGKVSNADAESAFSFFTAFGSSQGIRNQRT